MKHDSTIIDFSRHLIEDHLFYITTHLERLFPFEFFLTDAESSNHLFWIAEGSCFVMEEVTHPIRDEDKIDDKTYWHKPSHLFAYHIEYADISFYISARPVYKQQIDTLKTEIKNLEPAIQHYLELYTLAQHYISIYDSPLETHFFYNRTFDRKTFFKFTKESLDDDKLYCVCIKDYDPRNPISPQQLLSLGEKTRFTRTEPLFNFVYGNRSLMIYACCSASNFDPSKDYAASVRHAHRQVASSHSASYIVNSGVGSPHKPEDLFDSYKEAFFALAVGTLRGKKNFVLSFNDLGIFSLLLNHSINKITTHNNAFLRPLLDSPEGEERLGTLRTLIENDLRYKETAAQMYIHPNTLHYRVNKALDALGLDLACTEDLAELYSEILIHDVLKFCNFPQ